MLGLADLTTEVRKLRFHLILQAQVSQRTQSTFKGTQIRLYFS